MSAVTHLCHNVGICHIKMICIKFTEFWTKSGNYFTRNEIEMLLLSWSLTSRVEKSVRTHNQPFFCQSCAAEMQDELVERVWFCFFLFLLISLLLLHGFLGFTRKKMEVNNGLKYMHLGEGRGELTLTDKSSIILSSKA